MQKAIDLNLKALIAKLEYLIRVKVVCSISAHVCDQVARVICSVLVFNSAVTAVKSSVFLFFWFWQESTVDNSFLVTSLYCMLFVTGTKFVLFSRNSRERSDLGENRTNSMLGVKAGFYWNLFVLPCLSEKKKNIRKNEDRKKRLHRSNLLSWPST